MNDLRDLESLLDLMGRHGLCELEIESEGRKVRLRKPDPSRAGVPVAALAPAPLAPAAPAAAAPAPAEGPAALPANQREVTSPMVGTFYRASSPEADPFVREGDRVEDTSVLCIIEAMKVMNEIRAGMSGVVTEILAKNGESVEYGQPLFRLTQE